MRLPGTRLQNEKIYKWSTWKRYNEFLKLHDDMQVVYGWQIENIAFPPGHTFVLDKFSDDFINRRKEELNAYWALITGIPQVTDFTKHHCSETLTAFLEVDSIMAAGEASATENSFGEDVGEDSPKKTTIARRNSTGVTNNRSIQRRRSTGPTQNQSFFEESSSQPAELSPSKNSSTGGVGSAAAPASSAPASASAPVVDARFAPYTMMRKLLPEMALRHKMIADGFSDREIDDYFAATNPDGPQASASQQSAPRTAAPAPAPAAAKAAPAAAQPPVGTAKPPKASGARGALLESISARRIE